MSTDEPSALLTLHFVDPQTLLNPPHPQPLLTKSLPTTDQDCLRTAAESLVSGLMNISALERREQ